jgi:hypothetical protein
MDFTDGMKKHFKALEDRVSALELRMGPSADDKPICICADCGAPVPKREGLVDQLLTAVAEQQYTLNSMGWLPDGMGNEFSAGRARRFQWDKIQELLKALEAK